MKKFISLFLACAMVSSLACANVMADEIEAPAEEVIEEVIEEVVEAPAEEVAEELTEEPVEEPTEEPTEEPVEEITEEPAEDVVEEIVLEDEASDEVVEEIDLLSEEETDNTVENEGAPIEVAMPTATVSELDVNTIRSEKDIELTFAMNFLADEASEETIAKYEKWYADFVFTVSEDVVFNGKGTSDGYLAGSYQSYKNGTWLKVPDGDVSLAANEPFRLMAYAAEYLKEPGLKITYKDIVKTVQSFNCGAYFSDEFIKNHPDFSATLELRIYNNENEDESYRIGDAYVFDFATAMAWSYAQDSGTYGDGLQGMIRFLFDAQINKKITKVGIKFNNIADLSLNIDSMETTVTDNSSFYGDIYGITAGAYDCTYYALAYAETEDGQIYWSKPVSYNLDWNKHFTGYEVAGGAE